MKQKAMKMMKSTATFEVPQDELVKASLTLYFLDGHYLLRQTTEQGDAYKFIRASDVASAFSAREVDSGWLPAGVVRCGENRAGTWTVYSAAAQVVNAWLGETPVMIPIPRTVLLATGAATYLWAMTTRDFERDAKACRAPFPNVSPDGLICWGKNNRPDGTAASVKKVWRLFFEAPFNGDWAIEKCKSHKGDVRQLLKKLAENKAEIFPADELVETGKSIEKQIEITLQGEK